MPPVRQQKTGFLVGPNKRVHILGPIVPSPPLSDGFFNASSSRDSHKKENFPKNIIFSAFNFPPPVIDSTCVTLARGNSYEHGSAKTVLNSPQTIKTTFKKQDWMSNEYLDSILSLPLGVHMS